MTRILTGLLAAVGVALLGLSRIALGRHYPSDVLGGLLGVGRGCSVPSAYSATFQVAMIAIHQGGSARAQAGLDRGGEIVGYPHGIAGYVADLMSKAKNGARVSPTRRKRGRERVARYRASAISAFGVPRSRA
jgi:hypothetical protein